MAEGNAVLEIRIDLGPLAAALTEIGGAAVKMAEAFQRSMLALQQEVAEQLYGKLVLVVDDPADRHARSWREFGCQLVDIVRHEFWCAAGEPERSPGARCVRRRPPGATAALGDRLGITRKPGEVGFAYQMRVIQQAASLPRSGALR
jgi:hypothetical protein